MFFLNPTALGESREHHVNLCVATHPLSCFGGQRLRDLKEMLLRSADCCFKSPRRKGGEIVANFFLGQESLLPDHGASLDFIVSSCGGLPLPSLELELASILANLAIGDKRRRSSNLGLDTDSNSMGHFTAVWCRYRCLLPWSFSIPCGRRHGQSLQFNICGFHGQTS